MSTAALNRIANIAATAALQATSFFIGIWVAHKFSVAEFGTLQMLRLMIDYGLFLTFGVPAAVSFELPLALGSGKGSESAIATGVLLWTCLFAASVSMLALGSAEAFSLPLNGLYVPGQWIVSGLLLALTSLIIVPEIVLVSRESFRSLALARSCYTIVLTAGAILLVPSWGIVGFLVAMSGGAACEFLYWLLTSNGGLSFRWSLSHWKRYNSYGLIIQARKLLRVFLTSVDLWIISALMGSRAAGIYAFSSLLIRGYQFLPGMLYETAFPRAAKEFAQDEGKLALTMGYLFKYLSAATPLFVASAAASLGIFWVVIEYWMPHYAEAKLPFAILLLGAYCSSLAVMFTAVLTMARLHRQVALLEGATLVVAAILGVMAVALVKRLWMAATITSSCLAAEAVIVIAIGLQLTGWGVDMIRFVRESALGLAALAFSIFTMVACEHVFQAWPGQLISLIVAGSIAIVSGLKGLAKMRIFWASHQ